MAKSLRIVVVKPKAADASPWLRAGSDGGFDVAVVEQLQHAKREARRGPIDGLVVSGKDALAGLKDVSTVMEASGALIFAAPLSAAEACDGLRCALSGQCDGKSGRGAHPFQGVTLEEYLESKFGEFVRTMNASAARSLHATMIRSMEGPLIRHALRETDGNQIQAARLLGMNRNTLRKKIEAYRIAVKRRAPSRRSQKAV